MSKTLKKKIVLLTSPHNVTIKSPPIEEKLKKNSSTKIQKATKSMLPQPKRLNEDFINVLSELADLMIRKGEPFRARAYQKAEEAIIRFPDDIYDLVQLKGVPGIGQTILTKFEEFIKTGTIAALEKERNDPANILAQIYGVGPKKANELVQSGITTVEQLRENEQLLNDKQKIGLKYYDDILKRIPRSEIVEFSKLFREIFMKVAPPESNFEIVGSFRRGSQNSGDIDIIITNQNDNKKTFELVLDSLIKDKIITEVLSKGKTKSLTLVQIKKDGPIRRVDFLYSPPNEYAFALLYFTGSKLFNTVVRQRALDLGYTLNEHGLSYITKGVKGNRVDAQFPTEESILNFLGLAYVKPEDRIDGRSLVFIEKGSTSKDVSEEVPPASPEIDITEDQLVKALEEKEITDSELLEALEDSDQEISEADLLEALESPKKEKTPKNKTLKKKASTELTDEIVKFKKDGISILKMMTEKQLSDIIELANTKYYCDEDPILTDSEYDIIREFTLEKFPDNLVAKAGHTKCIIEGNKQKVKLPYELWSMDKIKPTTDALTKWTKKYKGPYVISAKLDGISALYVNMKEGPKLYTRGNGIYGQDISHLIPYLIKKNVEDVAVRGEIIIAKEIFDKKYKKEFANPRNFVAGIVNKKTVDPKIVKDLDFVAYELIHPLMKPLQQMLQFPQMDLVHVKFDVKEKISNEELSEILIDWRKDYKYEIDGVIVVNDEIYPRPKKNPDYAFAFKMVISDQVAEAKVVDVLWTPSKDGYLKPRVQIEPINLGGVTVEYATGFNAKFIEDNKIGVGSVITIIRSGDVIPHIISVVTPAEYVKFPSVPYKWNDTHVDIILDNKEEDDTVREKNITAFFKNLEVEGIGPGNVKRLVEAGFDSVAKILAMKETDFLKVDGFKKKTADKLYNGIREKTSKASLAEIMTASNVFGRGFGDKSFNKILEKYPDILTSKESDKEKKSKLVKVEGIANKTADKFVENIPDFIKFLDNANLMYKLQKQEVPPSEFDETHPLFNKKIVMTGFRDKELLERLKSIGAENSATVSKNTFAVIVKEDKDEDTGKADQARKLNIPIMTLEEFNKKYFS